MHSSPPDTLFVAVSDERIVRRRLWAYVLGTIAIVVGDALYGLGYYEQRIVEPTLYMVSAVLGVIAGGLYVYGGVGLAGLLTSAASRRLTTGALAIFGFMVAVVHAFAGAIMLVVNERLRAPHEGLDAVFELTEQTYGLLSAPMFAALVLGYGWLSIEIGRGRARVPRWTAALNPLLLAIPQQGLAELLWFPLRSPALFGSLWLLVLLSTLDEARARSQ